MLFLYGKRKSLIKSFDIFMYECPFCEENNSTTIAVYSWYVHVFWIPVFPYQKEAVAYCTCCNTYRNELKFGPKLVAEYKEKKRYFRHPLWTWSIIILLLALILTIIIIAPK